MVQDQPTWTNDMYRTNGPLAKPFQGACAYGVSFAAGISHTHAFSRYYSCLACIQTNKAGGRNRVKGELKWVSKKLDVDVIVSGTREKSHKPDEVSL